jgi:hypothetical protein
MKKTKGRYLYFFIKGWLSVLDGLVQIVTIGRYWTSFEYKYTLKNGMK